MAHNTTAVLSPENSHPTTWAAQIQTLYLPPAAPKHGGSIPAQPFACCQAERGGHPVRLGCRMGQLDR